MQWKNRGVGSKNRALSRSTHLDKLTPCTRLTQDEALDLAETADIVAIYPTGTTLGPSMTYGLRVLASGNLRIRNRRTNGVPNFNELPCGPWIWQGLSDWKAHLPSEGQEIFPRRGTEGAEL
jgi:hypothetical protein